MGETRVDLQHLLEDLRDVAVEPSHQRAFVNTFLTFWGKALAGPKRNKRK